MLTGTHSTTSVEIIDMIFEIAGVKRNMRFTSAARDHYATTAC